MYQGSGLAACIKFWVRALNKRVVSKSFLGFSLEGKELDERVNSRSSSIYQFDRREILAQGLWNKRCLNKLRSLFNWIPAFGCSRVRDWVFSQKYVKREFTANIFHYLIRSSPLSSLETYISLETSAKHAFRRKCRLARVSKLWLNCSGSLLLGDHDPRLFATTLFSLYPRRSRTGIACAIWKQTTPRTFTTCYNEGNKGLLTHQSLFYTYASERYHLEHERQSLVWT